MNKNLVKQKFSYNLTALQPYVEALSPDIISEAVLSPVTMSYVNVIPGIKGTQNVNLLSETLVVQTGTTCGWDNQGQVTWTTAPLTVAALKMNQSLCLQQLQSLWLGQYLNAGSYNTEQPFEQSVVNLLTSQIKRYNEDILWNASTATTSFSGYIELLQNTSGVVALTGQTALCSVTGSTPQDQANNVLSQVDNLINAMNRNVYDRNDITIYMSQQQFKCYIRAVRNVNNFWIDSTENKLGNVYDIYHPQTNYKVVGCPGLNGSDGIVLAPQQYMLAGVDLMSDEDGTQVWFSQDFQEVRMAANWKIGSQIAFPQFFVTNGLF